MRTLPIKREFREVSGKQHTPSLQKELTEAGFYPAYIQTGKGITYVYARRKDDREDSFSGKSNSEDLQGSESN